MNPDNNMVGKRIVGKLLIFSLIATIMVVLSPWSLGTQNKFNLDAVLRKPLPHTPQKMRAYFSAQPTPELAFIRYLEFCAMGMTDYSVDLFNDRTKTFFKYHRTTSEQRKAEAQAWDGVSYEVRRTGKWAVVFHPDNDYMEMAKLPPYFIEKTDKGWQIDLDAMARGLSFGGPYVHWVNDSWLYPYVQLFIKDYTLDPRMMSLRRKDEPTPEPQGIFTLFEHYQKPPRVWVGIYVAMTNEVEERFSGVPSTVVLDVCPGSPAEKGGLKRGDIILRVNGQKGPYGELLPEQFLDIIRSYKPGDILVLDILRNLTDKKRIEVQLEKSSKRGCF